MPCPSELDDPNANGGDVPHITEVQETAANDSLTSGAAHRVVSNTTPPITLGELGLIDALHELYADVWVPDAVFAEYER